MHHSVIFAIKDLNFFYDKVGLFWQFVHLKRAIVTRLVSFISIAKDKIEAFSITVFNCSEMGLNSILIVLLDVPWLWQADVIINFTIIWDHCFRQPDNDFLRPSLFNNSNPLGYSEPVKLSVYLLEKDDF